MLFSDAVNQALDKALEDERTVLCGQLVRYDHSVLTKGLYLKYPERVITYPTCEHLMNACALGLAIAGKRPIVMHERFNFALVGMDPLINHIPIYGSNLPILMMMIVGHGKGQGLQQKGDFSDFFKNYGWFVFHPSTPGQVVSAILHPNRTYPYMLVIDRSLY